MLFLGECGQGKKMKIAVLLIVFLRKKYIGILNNLYLFISSYTSLMGFPLTHFMLSQFPEFVHQLLSE